MKKTKFEILFLIFLSNLLIAQINTNYEVIINLVDSSAAKIFSELEQTDSEYSVVFKTVKEYSSLNSRTINAFGRAGIKINNAVEENKILYSINNVKVEYPDIFKDGIFGEFLVERKVLIKGEYQIMNKSVLKKADLFNFAVTDTIRFNKINSAENSSLPFTQGEKPTEPFFPSIFEPAIAIATVVVTAILFFSVRSK
jgi:hypothetical protein